MVPGVLSLPTRQAQPVFFGEVSESEFQEAITLVETSFLWPSLVTQLSRDPRQIGLESRQLLPPLLKKEECLLFPQHPAWPALLQLPKQKCQE